MRDSNWTIKSSDTDRSFKIFQRFYDSLPFCVKNPILVSSKISKYGSKACISAVCETLFSTMFKRIVSQKNFKNSERASWDGVLLGLLKSLQIAFF